MSGKVNCQQLGGHQHVQEALKLIHKSHKTKSEFMVLQYIDKNEAGECSLKVRLHDNTELKNEKFFLIILSKNFTYRRQDCQNNLRSQGSTKMTKKSVLCMPGQQSLCCVVACSVTLLFWLSSTRTFLQTEPTEHVRCMHMTLPFSQICVVVAHMEIITV